MCVCVLAFVHSLLFWYTSQLLLCSYNVHCCVGETLSDLMLASTYILSFHLNGLQWTLYKVQITEWFSVIAPYVRVNTLSPF